MSTRNTAGLTPLLPPEGLYERIVARLELLARRRARLFFAIETLVCFGSGLALVPLAQYAGQEFYASGFYEYASLLFSDRVLVLSSWQDVAYSLLESLPSMALLLLLLGVIVLVWSLRRAIQSGKTAFSPLHAI